MGHTKLRQTFRMLYGLSPSEYILNARMQYAKLLLSKPTPPIGAIAAHLGYASASKFSIAFRKVHNQSPEEYRAVICNRLSKPGWLLSMKIQAAKTHWCKRISFVIVWQCHISRRSQTTPLSRPFKAQIAAFVLFRNFADVWSEGDTQPSPRRKQTLKFRVCFLTHDDLFRSQLCYAAR